MMCALFSDAGAVMHTHSKHAVLATMLYPGAEFKISNQEMIKVIRKGVKGEFIFLKIQKQSEL